mmetsp:Transcript_668/g.2102  ORF Transcript_668/g.2102 Transcript_668/m.2102 type:complete len:201 (-) Transcript_668:1509-2111(-)
MCMGPIRTRQQGTSTNGGGSSGCCWVVPAPSCAWVVATSPAAAVGAEVAAAAADDDVATGTWKHSRYSDKSPASSCASCAVANRTRSASPWPSTSGNQASSPLSSSASCSPPSSRPISPSSGEWSTISAEAQPRRAMAWRSTSEFRHWSASSGVGHLNHTSCGASAPTSAAERRRMATTPWRQWESEGGEASTALARFIS